MTKLQLRECIHRLPPALMLKVNAMAFNEFWNALK